MTFVSRLVTLEYGGSGYLERSSGPGLASIGARYQVAGARSAKCPVVFRVMGAAGSDFCATLGPYSFFCGHSSHCLGNFPFTCRSPHHSLELQFVARLNREGPVSYVGVQFDRQWRHVDFF